MLLPGTVIPRSVHLPPGLSLGVNPLVSVRLGSLSDVEPVELLDHSGGRVQSFPLSGAGHNLQLLSRGELLLELLIHLLRQLGELLRLVVHKAESVLGQAVQDVQAVDLVALGNGKIKADNGQRVRLGNPQRRVEAGYEVGHLIERDELGGVRVKPDNLVGVKEINKM